MRQKAAFGIDHTDLTRLTMFVGAQLMRPEPTWSGLMTGLRRHERSLCELLDGAGQTSGRRLWAPDASVALDALARGTVLGDALATLHGRSVMVATGRQLASALA